MVKNITSWWPDSCGCVVDYSWDSDTDEDSRVHTFVGHQRRCSDHEHLWDQDVYDTVLEENQRKNITLQHAAEKTLLGHDSSYHPGGDRRRRMVNARTLRRDVHHSFFFTHQGEMTETSVKKPRILHLTFSENLETTHKDIIEQRFPGLVKIH